jgi:hypothetical protein
VRNELTSNLLRVPAGEQDWSLEEFVCVLCAFIF